ncbi:hypothetical protein [Leucobacter musarum]|uniref:hypothetical protein n=1 Tax=Leucobacter musarum TaxID=1930747 RepID=UPI0006A7DFF4|nr:hypothetical protein [Leucobacter musarum]
MSNQDEQRILDAARQGAGRAMSELRRAGVNAAANLDVVREQASALTDQQRAEFVDAGRAATARAHTALAEHKHLEAPVDVLAGVIADLEAHPFDEGAVRRQVNQYITDQVMLNTGLDASELRAQGSFELGYVGGAEAVQSVIAQHDLVRVQAAQERQAAIPAQSLPVESQLDRLGFSRRVNELHQERRIDRETVVGLLDMAAASDDLREFKSRWNYTGARLMGGAEHRYLDSALNTPEGQRADSWQEAQVWARAYGTDQRAGVAFAQQHEQQRQQQMAQQMAV